jgi:deoxyribonuclease V
LGLRMRISDLHTWDVTPSQATAIQQDLRRKVIREDRFRRIRSVAGVDVGYSEDGKTSRAGVVVLSYPLLEGIDQAVALLPVSFPYIPGLLSFREIPVILDALGKLARPPDLLVCDGHGYAHPRRFGLACHLGLLTGLPSIGVAKSILAGEHAPLAAERGAQSQLIEAGEVIGLALRTHRGVRPVYVSTGHRISLETAAGFVLNCSPKYRLPEPIRLAHQLASSG